MAATRFVLAVHGGAGAPPREGLDPAAAHRRHAGLRRALIAGRDILAAGGSALDAVTAAVVALEDDPEFNAGRGSVFTAAGTQEMDAAIMDGRDRRAGAVAGICGPKHPVLAARRVMEASPHVFLAGPGAIAFCRAQGLDFAEPGYFATASRRPQLAATDTAGRHGTVGAVARDGDGNLAAATSTGGTAGKAPGRIGDTPIIGAGTYADNGTCAVSATGEGEFFIRFAVAHEISARIAHGGQGLAEAAGAALAAVATAGGSGGLVAVDRSGTIALPFNTERMYRGYVGADGIVHTAILDEAYRSS